MAKNSISVANYVIQYANSHGKKITNLQLQKILYFLQAAFLVETDQPLIDGEFERWQYGPVMTEVYYRFNSYGASPIDGPSSENKLVIKEGKIQVERSAYPRLELQDKESELARRLLDNLLDKAPWDLVTLTHEQTIYKKYEANISNAPTYSNDEIKDAFESEDRDLQELWQN